MNKIAFALSVLPIVWFVPQELSPGDTVRPMGGLEEGNQGWISIAALNKACKWGINSTDRSDWTKEQLNDYKKIDTLTKSGSLVYFKDGQRLTLVDRFVLDGESGSYVMRKESAIDSYSKETFWTYRVRVKNGPLKGKEFYTAHIKQLEPDDGETCIMTNHARKATPAAFEISTLVDIHEAINKGDDGMLNLYISGKRAFSIEQKTKVAIASRSKGIYQIRIQSGKAKGKLLYVYAPECDFTIPDPNEK